MAIGSNLRLVCVCNRSILYNATEMELYIVWYTRSRGHNSRLCMCTCEKVYIPVVKRALFCIQTCDVNIDPTNWNFSRGTTPTGGKDRLNALVGRHAFEILCGVSGRCGQVQIFRQAWSSRASRYGQPLRIGTVSRRHGTLVACRDWPCFLLLHRAPWSLHATGPTPLEPTRRAYNYFMNGFVQTVKIWDLKNSSQCVMLKGLVSPSICNPNNAH